MFSPNLHHVAILGTRGYPSYYGGFETAVRHLVPALLGEGWQVTVFNRDRLDTSLVKHKRLSLIRSRGINSKTLSTLSHGFTSTVVAAVKRPDTALIMNVANGFWLPILKIAGIRTVVNVDGIEWERAKWGRLARAVFKIGARMTAIFADQIVADSQVIAQRWLSEFGRDSVFIAYGGETHSRETQLPGSVTPDEYVLYVARFVPENSIAEFLQAVRRLPANREVVIVGSSGFNDHWDGAVANLVASRPHTYHLGHVQDDTLLHTLWKHAGVYFHGHTVGGTNPALVQAMTSGAAVVATDTLYNREVLCDAGTYVNVDSMSIAAALEEMIGDNRRREESRARAQARASLHYTWTGICQAYITALNPVSQES